MYSVVTLTDSNGINSVDLDEFPYPLQKFDWDPDMVGGDGFAKPASFGRWDAFRRTQAMNIHCEGEIVTDTVTEYWAARKALMAIACPVSEQVERNHSRLNITLEGDGVSYVAFVQLQSMNAPIAALGSPTVSQFMFEWTCNVGYWTDAGSGALVNL